MWRHREELAALVTRDHGKTFPDALAGVTRGIETIEFACGLPVHLAGMNTPNVATNVDAVTLRRPLGVTAAITPFNFPAMVPMWIYPIALACGNTFILKPSSHTPGATQLQAELWKEAGLPDGVFNVVYGGREAVTAIVEHPDIQAIQFVGSTDVGRYVYEEGTRRGKRVGAFTSAKNAMVVLPDADLEIAADAAVAAGYGSAGERCMAQTLLIGVGGVTDQLRPMIEERIARLKIGPGHGARRGHGSDLHARAPRIDHPLDRQGRRGGRRAGRRRPAVPSIRSTRTGSTSGSASSTTSPRTWRSSGRRSSGRSSASSGSTRTTRRSPW